MSTLAAARGAESRLRTLSTEGAGQVGRAALLQQDNADQEQAHNHVHDNDEVKKNLHCLGDFPSLSGSPGRKIHWCGGGDLNPYALRRQHLKLVRLPISPPPHWSELHEYSKGCASFRNVAQPQIANVVNNFNPASAQKVGLGQIDHLVAASAQYGANHVEAEAPNLVGTDGWRHR